MPCSPRAASGRARGVVLAAVIVGIELVIVFRGTEGGQMESMALGFLALAAAVVVLGVLGDRLRDSLRVGPDIPQPDPTPPTPPPTPPVPPASAPPT